jgi:voltage-gated potassium channel
MAAALRWLNRRVRLLAALFLGVLAFGTTGYRLIVGPSASLLDCLYMTFITITTIGYGEIFDLSQNPAGRVFSMFVALFGIGILTYVVTSVTAFAVDGDLQAFWRRKRMDTSIARMNGHYILCGWGPAAPYIARELLATGRAFVVAAPDRAAVVRALGEGAEIPVIEGDVAADDVLRRMGVERAAGLFAASGEDHVNVVICLAARHLNAALRIVASAADPAQAGRMTRVGAQAVVSTEAIGGLRMASEMVRPSVVNFLDTMLRGSDPVLRVEEVAVAPSLAGAALSELPVDEFPQSLLVALKTGAGWTFKPGGNVRLSAGDVLVFIASPSDRDRLRARLGG